MTPNCAKAITCTQYMLPLGIFFNFEAKSGTRPCVHCQIVERTWGAKMFVFYRHEQDLRWENCRKNSLVDLSRKKLEIHISSCYRLLLVGCHCNFHISKISKFSFSTQTSSRVAFLSKWSYHLLCSPSPMSDDSSLSLTNSLTVTNNKYSGCPTMCHIL